MVDTVTIRKQTIRLKIEKIDRITFNRLAECYICCESKGNTICYPCCHKDICLECTSRLERCPQCRRTIEELLIFENQ